MAYDSLNKVGILFGGSTTTGSVGDTWQWDGSNWTELTPTTSPPNTFAQSMTYDSAHQQIIMFGGFASNQTWLWDGTNWNLPSITGDSPSQRTFASLAFDETTQTSVLFGGSDSNGTFFNDTWEWDGTQWTLDTPATSPSARNGAAITYDPALHVVLLQGGNNAQGQLSDTWQWDGSTWTMLSVSGAPASQYPQMVYDALLGQEVLFAIFTGTFTYDGTSWNSSSLPSVLAGTSFEAMMYDDDKQEAIVFGGNASAGQSNQTWAYGPQP